MFIPINDNTGQGRTFRQREKIEEPIESTLFCKQIKPLLLFGITCGTFPLKETARGFESGLRSSHMLYSMSVYVVITIFTVLMTIDMVHIFNVSALSGKMYSQILIVLVVTYGLTPLNGWLDIQKIAEYLNSWTEFQVSFFNVTRQSLDVKMKKKVVLFSCYAVLESTIPVIGMLSLAPHLLKPWHIPVLCITGVVQSSIVALWIVTCRALGGAGETLAERFKAVKRNNYSAIRIFEYRQVWLQLNHLSLQTGNTCYRGYGFYILVHMWLLTTGANGCLVNLIEGDYYKTLICFGLSVLAGIPMYMVCIVAHSIPYKITHTIKRELQKTMSSTVCSSVWQEENAFLQTMEMNPSVINLGGYVSVNRQLIYSVSFFEVTRQVLDLKIRKKVILLSVFSVIESAVPPLGMLYIAPHLLKTWQVPILSIAGVVQAVTVALWIMTCEALCQAGETLSECFKTGKINSAKHVLEYRKLWLALSRLTLQSGDTAYGAYGMYVIVHMWMLTTGVHGFITNLLEGYHHKMFTFLVLSALTGTPMFLVYHKAHSVPHKITHNMQRQLQEIPSSTLTDSSCQEVKTFLQVMEMNQTDVQLGGFVTLNRQLIHSLGATIVTYSIMLLQYNMSLSDN